MSTVDDLLDFGSAGNNEASNANDFGEISWQASSNTDLLGDFDASKPSDDVHAAFETNKQPAQEGSDDNTGLQLDDSNPFAVKTEGSDNFLMKDFGFESELLSESTSSNPFGEGSPFDSNFATEPTEEAEESVPHVKEDEEEEEEEEEAEETEEAEEEEEADEKEEEKEELESDEEGPQVSSAIDDQVYYQDSSSEEEQNFDTIRPYKPTPAKRPSTSAVTPETHEEEDETAAAVSTDLVEEEENEEEEEVEEEAEPEEPDEEVTAERMDATAGDSVNGDEKEDDSNVEAFLSSRNRRFEEEDVDDSNRRSRQMEHEDEAGDGSGFAYQEHVFQRDPSPELRESSRYVADTSATFDHAEGGSDEMCRSCGKRVYQMERLIADKHVYHKMCFKCAKCRRILSVGNFAVNNNELYCKPHFMELFKKRGRYDDNPNDEQVGSNNGHSAPVPAFREEPRAEELPAGDVIRADEKVDDGIAAGPSLSNLRSRFEATDSAEPQVPSAQPPKQTRQWKYQQQQQREEEQQRQVDSYDGERRPSRSDELREEELPPQNMARNLAAKFRELESTGGPPVPKVSPRCERRQMEHSIEQDREIVREADGNDVRPEAGTTRSLVSVWRNLESGDGRKEMSPPFHRPVVETTHRQDVADQSERRPSYPSPTSERVISGEEPPEDELPPRDTTKSMAAIFRALESQGGPPPTPDSAKQIQAKAREQSSANSTVRLPNRDAGPISLEDDFEPEHTNGHGGYAENEPVELDPNVVRNDEPPPMEELPERGTTRNLVAMFKSMEAN